MERTNSEDGEDLDEPNWEVDPKVELDVDMKESDNTKDDVSQQKHKSKTKSKIGGGALLPPFHSCFECDKAFTTIQGQKKHGRIQVRT